MKFWSWKMQKKIHSILETGNKLLLLTTIVVIGLYKMGLPRIEGSFKQGSAFGSGRPILSWSDSGIGMGISKSLTFRLCVKNIFRGQKIFSLKIWLNRDIPIPIGPGSGSRSLPRSGWKRSRPSRSGLEKCRPLKYYSNNLKNTSKTRYKL